MKKYQGGLLAVGIMSIGIFLLYIAMSANQVPDYIDTSNMTKNTSIEEITQICYDKLVEKMRGESFVNPKSVDLCVSAVVMELNK